MPAGHGIDCIDICSGFLFRGEVMDMDKRKLSDNALNKVAGGRWKYGDENYVDTIGSLCVYIDVTKHIAS